MEAMSCGKAPVGAFSHSNGQPGFAYNLPVLREACSKIFCGKNVFLRNYRQDQTFLTGVYILHVSFTAGNSLTSYCEPT